MNESKPNESDMLLKLIAALEVEFDRHPKAFTHEVDIEYLNPLEKETRKSDGYRAYKKLQTRFYPKNDPNCSKTNIEQILIQWTPVNNEFFIYIEYTYNNQNPRNNYSSNFILEPNDKTDLAIRKRIYHVFKKIRDFYEVEEPRREKEQLISAIYDAFPEMLDIELFGEELDKES
jgi:hypothetical protein